VLCRIVFGPDVAPREPDDDGNKIADGEYGDRGCLELSDVHEVLAFEAQVAFVITLLYTDQLTGSVLHLQVRDIDQLVIASLQLNLELDIHCVLDNRWRLLRDIGVLPFNTTYVVDKEESPHQLPVACPSTVIPINVLNNHRDVSQYIVFIDQKQVVKHRFIIQELRKVDFALDDQICTELAVVLVV
jgi:hypothetical protein